MSGLTGAHPWRGRSASGETVIKLGPNPLPDHVERPLYVPDAREDDWLKDQLAVPKMPWEMGDTAAR